MLIPILSWPRRLIDPVSRQPLTGEPRRARAQGSRENLSWSSSWNSLSAAAGDTTLQTGQKGLRCKARDDRRAEAYSVSTLERVDRSATKQMGLFHRSANRANL